MDSFNYYIEWIQIPFIEEWRMKMEEKERLNFKTFINKVLTGTAQGTIIALIPNAVLSAILTYFSHIEFANMIIQAAVIFQLATPMIIGALIAKQFDLDPMKIMIAGGAAFIGSGVIKFDQDVSAYIGSGTGDVINIMLTTSVAILLLIIIGDTFGSSSIIGLPIAVGVGAGVIGMVTYPFVTQVTLFLGNIINTFTELQPILMAVLISCSFAVLIISPITTVGIGLAIGLNGMSAGAAAMGVASTTIVLVINSWKANESGITLAIALGGMKMMMPNLFKYPIILIPSLFTAMVSGVVTALFGISGTPASAGFGLVGLVGPLASLDSGLNIFNMILAWFIIPVAAAILGNILFEKILKLYDSKLVFRYQG